MAAVVLVALAAGPTAFAALIGVGVVVLAWEWACLTGGGRFGSIGAVLALAMIVVAAVAAVGHGTLALAVAVLAATILLILARATGHAHPRWIAFGAPYIGVPATALIWLRGDAESGRELILWLLLTVWATDIGAFFAGRLIGGPRLAPRISPKKTWAGLGGAIVASALIGIALARLDSHAPSAVVLAAFGAALAVIAQAGDLGESWVKRRFGAKDSSHLIPGHGGLFDRVDGLIAAATALALGQYLTGGVLEWR